MSEYELGCCREAGSLRLNSNRERAVNGLEKGLGAWVGSGSLCRNGLRQLVFDSQGTDSF